MFCIECRHAKFPLQIDEDAKGPNNESFSLKQIQNGGGSCPVKSSTGINHLLRRMPPPRRISSAKVKGVFPAMSCLYLLLDASNNKVLCICSLLLGQVLGEVEPTKRHFVQTHQERQPVIVQHEVGANPSKELLLGDSFPPFPAGRGHFLQRPSLLATPSHQMISISFTETKI